jgi:nucleoid-associated protein YgaU
MKTLKISLFAAAAFTFAVNTATAQEVRQGGTVAPATLQAPQQQKPMGLTFAEDTHTFGDIPQDKPVSHDFTFKNTSSATILITGVKPSCGCTATNYTKTPIKPGESGSVTATYNAHAAGPFTKTLTVTTNDTETTKTLYIKGKVIANEAAAPAATPATSPTKMSANVPAKQPAGVKTHTVVEGESLSLLAGKYYGDIYKYNVIYEANKDIIADSKLITPGQVIKIPAAKSAKSK